MGTAAPTASDRAADHGLDDDYGAPADDDDRSADHDDDGAADHHDVPWITRATGAARSADDHHDHEWL